MGGTFTIVSHGFCFLGRTGFSWEGLLRKSLPNPLQKLLKQGLGQIKNYAAVPRSERIAGFFSFSDSFPHWLPQVLGTPAPKTPNDTIPLRTVLRQNAPQAQFMVKPIHAGGNSCNRKVAIHCVFSVEENTQCRAFNGFFII